MLAEKTIVVTTRVGTTGAGLSCSVLLRKEIKKPLKEDSGKGCRGQSSYVLVLKEGMRR